MTGSQTNRHSRNRPPRLGRRSRGLLLGGLRHPWRTWRWAYEFDRRLAGGGDPIDSDELSFRVGRLRLNGE